MLLEPDLKEGTMGKPRGIRLAGLSALGLWLLAVTLAGCCPDDGEESNAASSVAGKHVILFIGDGMQLENEISLSRYLHGTDDGLAWQSFPYQAFVTTWDVSSYNAYASDLAAPPFDEATFDPLIGYDPSQGGVAPYPLDLSGIPAYLGRAATDSASAATALATGFKTDSGNISWLRNDPPGGALETVAEMMRAQKGAAIGVVTTVPISHATPAAFVSHNTNRGNYYQIADEIINVTAPEVVIGGGHPSWNGGYVTAAQLAGLRASTVYSLVERESGQDGGVNLLYAAESLDPGLKLFGLFGGSGGNFEPPVPHDNPGHPGFIVESENPSLAEATTAALLTLARDHDGFFLMVEGGDIDWANHANDFAGMIGTMWQLNQAVAAAIEFVERPGDDIDWTNTLLIVTADHATGGLRLNDAMPLGQGDLPLQVGSSYPDGDVAYNTGGHTNELVTLYAIGSGLDLFALYEGARYPGARILDNTEVFLVMARAAGL